MRTGKIIQVSGSVVDVRFPHGELPRIREALSVELNGKRLVMEVEQHLSAETVRCIMLSGSEGLSRGMTVTGEGSGLRVPVGKATLGRLFNVFGDTIDGGAPIGGAEPRRSIHRKPPAFDEQSPSVEILETGIKVIDLLEPYPQRRQDRPVRRRGRRQDGAHSGAYPQHRRRARRLFDLHRRGRAQPRGQRPLERDARERRYRQDRARLRPDERSARRSYARGAVGPYDGRILPRRGAAATCCCSSTTFSASCRRAARSRPCWAACPPPSAISRRSPNEMGELQERITSTKSGSITSVQAVYVPADDLTDPAPATTFTHLDATTVLSRKIAEQGIYPGGRPARIDLPHSGSGYRGRASTTAIARSVQETLQKYRELQDIIAILGMEELSDDGQGDGQPREKDPALFGPADVRGRKVHGPSGRLCAA